MIKNKKLQALAIVLLAIAIALLFKLKNTSEKVITKADEKGVKTVDNFFVQNQKELDSLISDKKPDIIMFGTASCTFCQEMKPYVNKLANKYKDKVNIKYVDADELSDVASKYPIKGVPALYYRNGDGTGFVPSKDKLESLQNNNNMPEAYAQEKTGKHEFTMTYGLIKEDFLESLIGELIANAK